MNQDILDLKQSILQEIQTTSISEEERSIIDEIGEDKYAEFMAKLIIRVRKRFKKKVDKGRIKSYWHKNGKLDYFDFLQYLLR